MNEPHVCRYLELLPNGSYYCGGCGREYRLSEQQKAPPEVEEALKVVYQALLEVRHAQEVGADWYTKGRMGLYQQVAMWVRKGFDAIDTVRASFNQSGSPRDTVS